jgi:hypothetical protein
MSTNIIRGIQNEEEVFGLTKAIETSWDAITEQTTDDVVKRTQCLLGENLRSYIIPFLGQKYTLKMVDKTVETQDGNQFFNLFIIGIILHYMTHAQAKPMVNKFISFRELWGGNEYFYAFNNRVLKPLIGILNKKPERLITIGEYLGGEKIEKGEFGVTIPALPRVPITILYWSGDEEVDASANLLFDATANEQMETEALAWLSIATVGELKKIKL